MDPDAGAWLCVQLQRWQALPMMDMHHPPRFVRHPANPILLAVPGTWMESQTANPDLLLMGDAYHLYFRGRQGGHDRIGLGRVSVNESTA